MNAPISVDLKNGNVTQLKRRKKNQNHRCAPKRQRYQQSAISGGVFQCFTIDGDDVNLHRRSKFSDERKEEVKGIRRKGACLRCRLLKRACSGEDPCKLCIAAAKAAAGSRALSWMECIRPSFQSMNIFDRGTITPGRGRIDTILNNLLDDDVYLDFHIPFALNVEAASAHLASWLSDDDASSTFSVVGVFSCSTNTNLLENALDPNLGRDLRLFVHLTTHLYTTGMEGGYRQYTDEEIQTVRDSVGSRLLLALDPLLRPTELEGSEDKLGKMKSLFLLLLGTTVGMRYTCPEIIDQGESNSTNVTGDPRQEALLRLLCHYLIFIGKATSLLDPSSDEKTLLNKWRSQWNKPAAFTWNSLTGLEMHYRIQPPADWIVSPSEDGSMSSIDIDLSDFDDGAEFTVNTDLLKCTACGSFWASLDTNGCCENCNPIVVNSGTRYDKEVFTLPMVLADQGLIDLTAVAGHFSYTPEPYAAYDEASFYSFLTSTDTFGFPNPETEIEYTSFWDPSLLQDSVEQTNSAVPWLDVTLPNPSITAVNPSCEGITIPQQNNLVSNDTEGLKSTQSSPDVGLARNVRRVRNYGPCSRCGAQTVKPNEDDRYSSVCHSCKNKAEASSFAHNISTSSEPHRNGPSFNMLPESPGAQTVASSHVNDSKPFVNSHEFQMHEKPRKCAIWTPNDYSARGTPGLSCPNPMCTKVWYTQSDLERHVKTVCPSFQASLRIMHSHTVAAGSAITQTNFGHLTDIASEYAQSSPREERELEKEKPRLLI